MSLYSILGMLCTLFMAFSAASRGPKTPVVDDFTNVQTEPICKNYTVIHTKSPYLGPSKKL